MIEIISPPPTGASATKGAVLTAQCMLQAGSAVLREPLEKVNRGGVASHSRRQLEPQREVGPPSVVARRLRPFSSSTGCPDANKVGHLRPMAFPERFAAGPERRHGPQTERGAEHGTNAASRRLNAPADRLLKSV